MGVLHVRQLRVALERSFNNLVDTSDSRSQQEREDTFLTRSLASFALVLHANLTPEVAAACIVDGFDDHGIDAVYYDEREKRLFIVQSKWIHNGKRGIRQEEALKFANGIQLLVSNELDEFNEKFERHAETISRALEDAGTKIVLILAHTSTERLSDRVKQPITKLLRELNEHGDIASFEVMGQAELHTALAKSAEGAPINLDVLLSNWGQMRDPYQAYYGQISAAEVASWFQVHKNRLFAKNLRKLISASDVNATLQDTLRKSPESFWYFNNGITVLCERIRKAPLGGPTTESGVFTCEGVSIVNGAQTVGCIAAAFASDPERTKAAKVLIRFISLEHCPADFATAVTRATNTQNRIESKDFAALDPNQQRLRTELLLDGKEYAYKTGDAQPPHEKGCTVDDATVALACARPEVTLAVHAKAKISRLWDDINKPPYTQLFNDRLTGIRLWRLVELLRAVDETLKTEQSKRKRTDKSRLVAVHGNLTCPPSLAHS